MLSYSCRAPISHLSNPLLSLSQLSIAEDDEANSSARSKSSLAAQHARSRGQKITIRLQRIYSEGDRAATPPNTSSSSCAGFRLPKASLSSKTVLTDTTDKTSAIELDADNGESPLQSSETERGIASAEKKARFDAIRLISRQHRAIAHNSGSSSPKVHGKCRSLPADSELEAVSVDMMGLLPEGGDDDDNEEGSVFLPNQHFTRSSSIPSKTHRAKSSAV